MNSPDRGPVPRTARDVALQVIRRVTEHGAYSNLSLAAELGGAGLDDRDRRFASELAYGTLRRLGSLDRSIEQAADRPIGRIDPATRAVLRLGAYQIRYMRVPAHAAVSETVALAGDRARGFVNAVLRRLAAAPGERAMAPAGSPDDETVSGRTGLASWAVGELRRLLPSAEVEPAAGALAEPAGLTLRANRGRSSPEALAAALAESGIDVAPGRHHPDVLRVGAFAPAGLPGFADGWFAVQDEASVLVAAALEARPGERILDACAGPGGKAAHLAGEVEPGGLVIGADLRARRAALVTEATQRLGVRVPVLVEDARSPALRAEAFDAVLVDAPCSGLGAARRRPELLWRVPKDRLSALARLQVAILIGVAPLVRKGGRLLYSVCTYPRAETDAVVRAFVSKRPDFRPADVPGPDGRATSHRLWPHRHGTDGMFFAAFTRADGIRG